MTFDAGCVSVVEGCAIGVAAKMVPLSVGRVPASGLAKASGWLFDFTNCSANARLPAPSGNDCSGFVVVTGSELVAAGLTRDSAGCSSVEAWTSLRSFSFGMGAGSAGMPT